MSKITTENCKVFLITHFKSEGIQTEAKDWKRASKSKSGDVVNREFNHPVLGLVVVSEDVKGLSILSTHAISQNIKKSTLSINQEYIQKAFTSQEKKASKELLAKYIESSDDEDHVDKLMLTTKWIKYQHALPSQFYFCFPDDTYSNDKDNVINGLDTPMKIKEKYSIESFNVIFTDKSGSDIDLYGSDCLRNGVLPEWTDFMDEYHLNFRSEAPDLTVREWFKMLLQMGFEYKDDNCLFTKYLKKIVPLKSFDVNKEKDEELIKDATIKSILNQDDMLVLKELIDSGLDKNIILSGGDNILVYAYREKADNCLDVLLGNGFNIWSDAHGQYCTASLMESTRYATSEKEQLANLLFLMGHMEKQLPTNNLFEKMNIFFSNTAHSAKNKQIFNALYQFSVKILPEQQVNQIILNSMESVSRQNPSVLMSVIKSCAEQDFKNSLVSNIDCAYIVNWCLGQRKVDISQELINEVTVVEHLTSTVEKLKDKINELSNKTFRLVMISHDGTEESEIDKVINKYNSFNKLLSTVQSCSGNINKPKL